MAKKPPPKRGRPFLAVKKDVQLRVRVDQSTEDALEVYRVKHHLGDKSDAVRHLIARGLTAEGLLK